MSQQHLWRAVLDRSAECGQQLAARDERGRPEVDQFDVERRVDDDVLVLDVPVQNLQRVQVAQRRADLDIRRATPG